MYLRVESKNTNKKVGIAAYMSLMNVTGVDTHVILQEVIAVYILSGFEDQYSPSVPAQPFVFMGRHRFSTPLLLFFPF